MKDKKIVLLAGKGQSTTIIFNVLEKRFGLNTVIMEDKESTSVFLKRRIKRLGIFTVAGQISFQIIIPKLLFFFSKKRINEIIKNNHLDLSPIPKDKVKNVTSVNSIATIELLKTLKPDLIIVNGTRIISKKVLQSVDCKFINMHAGMTPMYRGVHGTYWALVKKDEQNSGVTVHFVDEGIDTGTIISQKQVPITSKDNFITYPLLQLSVGIGLLVEAVGNYFTDKISISAEKGESNLYYHPTIFEYLYYRIVRKVK